MDKNSIKLVWLDIEMTGLDPDKDHMLQIGIIITDLDLMKIDSLAINIYQPDCYLAMANPWCKKTFGGPDGLLVKSQESLIDLISAQELILNFLETYTSRKVSFICGKSVWHDRRFLIKHMPLVDGFFNHRMIDVTTLSLICLNHLIKPYPCNNYKHEALADLEDHINEYKYLMKHIQNIKLDY